MPVLSKDQASKPPKRQTPRQSAAAAQAEATAQKSTAHDNRVQGVNGVFQMLSVACVVRKQYADAAALGSMTPPISEELANIADADEKIAKAIDMLSVTGPYSKLIAVTLPLGLQLAANHKMVHAESVAQFGVTPPDLLETKMRLEIEKQFAEMRAEIDKMRAEIATQGD